MRLTPLDNIRNNICRPCSIEDFGRDTCSVCRVLPKGDPDQKNNVQLPFSIKYGIKENGSKYNVKLQLENDIFDLEVSHTVISNDQFPFWQCRFNRNHFFRIYGLMDFKSTDNSFMHYFVRDDQANKFYYLGRLGHMAYEKDEQRDGGPVFSVLESGLLPEKNRLSYYQLKDNKLHCIKGTCLADNGKASVSVDTKDAKNKENK